MKGRPKEPPPHVPLRKFTRVYEDEETIETWYYNLDVFDKGPVEVNIEFKKGTEKIIKQRAKEAKQIKKTARQMKKINNKK